MFLPWGVVVSPAIFLSLPGNKRRIAGQTARPICRRMLRSRPLVRSRMKKLTLFALTGMIFWMMVQTTPAAAQAEHAQTYTLDPAASTIGWEGHKFFGGNHTGTIDVRDGRLQVVDGKLVGGSFTIDMNSIQVTDLEGETAAKLAAHLKTDDFFDVPNHPVATFEISRVEYGGANQAAIVGDLTLRGVKQQLVFLATIDVKGGTLQATAKGVRVDRTVHDAKYGSIRFFSDLGRKIVGDEFTLDIAIQATR